MRQPSAAVLMGDAEASYLRQQMHQTTTKLKWEAQESEVRITFLQLIKLLITIHNLQLFDHH